MARHTPNRASDSSEGGFDLTDIFIGRQQQLDLFEIYLHRWKQLILDAAPDDSPVATAPSPNNRIQGLVVLLFGRGGFGKSTLLKYYRNMVLHADWNLAASKLVDWEFAVEGKRGLLNPPPGQQLDAAAYFKVLCGELAFALDKDPKAFRAYQSAVQAVEQVQKEAGNVLDGMQKDDRYGWLRELTVEAITSAVRTYLPGSTVVLENQRVKDAADAVAKLTQEQIVQIHAKLRNRLGSKLGDYLEPSLRLGLALGSDLRDVARSFPLLIFFDTYEEADEADRLLRIIMGAAGMRVGWVLAGRDNLWAGSDQRERSVDIEYGYKEIVPSDRGLSINFNAGDVGAFTLSDISEYFALLRKKVPYQPPLPAITEEQAKGVLEVTQGVPLAVKIAAGLYLETANLETVTEHVEGRRAIVDQMVRRYLLHTRANQEERARLYGLALLRRADQPTAIAAALGLTPEQAQTSYSSELSRLQRRYSFIFTEKEQPALHQEVRNFLRLWLQEHRKEPEIAASNERLKEAHETALKHLEEQMQYTSLKERLHDDEWVGSYLDLTEQQFWLDPVEGVRYALPFMLAAAIYRRAINEDAATIGKLFEQQIRQSYRDWWMWATHSLVYTTSRNAPPEALTGLGALAGLASERCPSFPPSLPDYRKELEAALWWRLGESYRGRDVNQALVWYERALTRLDKETELREAAAEACYKLGSRLYQEKKYTESLRVLNRAVELKPDYAWAYIVRGLDYYDLKQYQRAIADYDRAIELDPNYAAAYYNRGFAYGNLKQPQRAIADYDRAIQLDLNLALAYTNRGIAHRDLKQPQQAIADYDRAIQLDPNLALAYTNRGNAYRRLKEYEQAIQDCDHTIKLDPNDATAYTNRGIAYLWLKNVAHARDDYNRSFELDSTDVNAAWMSEWAGMSKRRPGVETAARLEAIATIDPQQYVGYIWRGVALGLRGNVKEGLEEVEWAFPLYPQEWDAYFWKGMLLAYYRGQSHAEEAVTMIERSLSAGLPPMLLTPLYWLEKDRPDLFVKYARPLLLQEGVYSGWQKD